MSINIQNLEQLRIFEESCLAALVRSQGIVAPINNLSNYHKHLSAYLVLGFSDKPTLNEDNCKQITTNPTTNIEIFKENILKLPLFDKNDKNFYFRESPLNKPLYSVRYNNNNTLSLGDNTYYREDIITKNQMSLEQLITFNYPQPNDVGKFLQENNIQLTGRNTNHLYIQDVVGNGECFFRSFINGYRFLKTKDNLGYYSINNSNENDSNINSMIIALKQYIINFFEYCLCDIHKKDNKYNCSTKLYNNFRIPYQDFEEYRQILFNKGYYGGILEALVLSNIFNVKINLFQKFSNNTFTLGYNDEGIVDETDGNPEGTINMYGTGGHFMMIYHHLD
jgi:hypothetical protein